MYLFSIIIFKRLYPSAILCFLWFSFIPIAVECQVVTYNWLNTAPNGNLSGFEPRWLGPEGGPCGGSGCSNFPNATPGIIRFNNNNNVLMVNNTTNERFMRGLVFAPGNTITRTITGDAGFRIIFPEADPFVRNESSANHVIDNPILANFETVNLRFQAHNGSLSFLKPITYNISRTLFIEGLGGLFTNRWVLLGGVISGPVGLEVTEFGIARLNALHTYTGTTLIRNGEILLLNEGDIVSSTITVGSDENQNRRAAFYLGSDTENKNFTRDLTIVQGDLNTRVLGSLHSNGTNTMSGNIALLSSNPTIIEVENTEATMVVSGVISGSSNINKRGQGTLALTNENTHTGELRATVGAISIGNGGSTGSIASSPIVVTSNLIFNRGNNFSVSSIITGSGTITKLGGAVTALTGNSTFDGNLIIQSGNITIGNGATSGSLNANTIVNNGSITFNRADDIEVASTISGTGSMRKEGAGKLSLSGDLTYTGTTFLIGGILQLNKPGGNTLPESNSLFFGSNGTLQVSTDQTFNSVNLGNGTIIVDSGVTLTINGTLTLSSSYSLQGEGTIIANGLIDLLAGNYSFPPSDFNLNNGTPNTINSLRISGSGTRILQKDLALDGGLNCATGTFNLNGNTITLNNGSVSRTSGNIDATVENSKIIFNNNTDRALLSGLFTGVIANFSKTGVGNLDLLESIEITETLEIEAGNINTGASFEVLLGPAAALIENNGFINGRVSTLRNFVSGEVNSFGNIGFTINSLENLGSTSVTRVTGSILPGEDGTSIARYFLVQPSNNSNLNAAVQFIYNDSDIPVGFDLNSIELFKRPIAGDATDWINLNNPIRDLASKTISVSGIPNFSIVTAATPNFSSTSLLPVELVTFSGSKRENAAILHWKTASEVNNFGFEVERGTDALNFEWIGFVPGNGTSSILNSYSFKDKEINSDQTFYRLRQVDFNGEYEYSPTILVQDTERRLRFNVADNKSFWRLEIYIPEQENITINLLDVRGKYLKREMVIHGGGRQYVNLAKPETNGVYLIELQSKWGREVIKVAN
ncbi:MAG: autotransporter-associated beta strand repeat-containing protein [Luteibaculaceae bacterium]